MKCLKNEFISYEDVLLLKGIEEVFERYYNSGVFKGAMEYLLEKYNSPFEMFKNCGCFTTETDTIKSDNREILCMKYCRIFVMMNCLSIF